MLVAGVEAVEPLAASKRVRGWTHVCEEAEKFTLRETAIIVRVAQGKSLPQAVEAFFVLLQFVPEECVDEDCLGQLLQSALHSVQACVQSAAVHYAFPVTQRKESLHCLFSL